jgi:hypothetical protein
MLATSYFFVLPLTHFGLSDRSCLSTFLTKCVYQYFFHLLEGTVLTRLRHQYGNSRALPPMLDAMNQWGAFLFFAVECFLSLVLVWFFLPETAGRTLEEMEELFDRPWWQIGTKGGKVKKSTGFLRDEEFGDVKEKKADMVMVSKLEKVTPPPAAEAVKSG